MHYHSSPKSAHSRRDRIGPSLQILFQESIAFSFTSFYPTCECDLISTWRLLDAYRQQYSGSVSVRCEKRHDFGKFNKWLQNISNFNLPFYWLYTKLVEFLFKTPVQFKCHFGWFMLMPRFQKIVGPYQWHWLIPFFSDLVLLRSSSTLKLFMFDAHGTRYGFQCILPDLEYHSLSRITHPFSIFISFVNSVIVISPISL